MQTNQFQPQDNKVKTAQRQQGGLVGFVKRNRVFSWVIGSIFSAIILVFVTAVCLLRFYFLPYIDNYRPEIESLITQVIERPVKIATIEGEMDGLDPVLRFKNIEIQDLQGKKVFLLDGVEAEVSWSSLFHFDLQLNRLTVNHPDISVMKDVNGNIYVAGFPINTNKSSDKTISDWLVRQHCIEIRDGRLSWQDLSHPNANATISDIFFQMQNDGRSHQVTLSAKPDADIAQPLQVTGTFTHPIFTHHISDVLQWSGTIETVLKDVNLVRISDFVSLPVRLSEGNASTTLRALINDGIVDELDATVQGTGIGVQIEKNLPELQFSHIGGELSLENISDDSDVSQYVYTIRHLSAQMQHGQKITDLGISLTEEPQKALSQAGRVDIEHAYLDELQELFPYLPLQPQIREKVLDYAANGEIVKSYFSWNLSEDSRYQAEVDFKNLGFKDVKNKKIDIQGLSGQLSMSQDQGELTLDSQHVVIQSMLYPKPQVFDVMSSTAKWQVEDHVLDVDLQSLRMKQGGFEIDALGQYQHNLQSNRLGYVDMSVKTSQLPLVEVKNFVPLQSPGALYQWLTHALKKGTSPKGEIRIRGNLEDFPFSDGKSGEFTVQATIENGGMNYTPLSFDQERKEALWPDLENIQGVFRMNGTHLAIHADSATTCRTPLNNVDVVVADVTRNPTLDITGQASGDMQNMMGFILHSPVSKWIGHFTDDAVTTGNATVDIKLHLPLEKIETSTVLGNVKFNHNDIVLFEDLPVIANTQGGFQFTEKGFSIDQIQAQFLHEPVTITGGTQQNGQFLVKANGVLSASGVRKTYVAGPMKEIVSYATGSAPYTVQVSSGRVQIDSDLKGFGVHMPAPLIKPDNEARALKVVLSDAPSRNGYRFDALDVTLGEKMSAHYKRQKHNKGAWRIVQGTIGVNAKPTTEKPGLSIAVATDTIDFQKWHQFLGRFSASNAAHQQKKDTGGGLASYFMPQYLDIYTEDVDVFGVHVAQAHVQGYQRTGQWDFDINAKNAAGKLTWVEPTRRLPTGKLIARLSHADLHYPKGGNVRASNVNDLTGLPALDVVVNKLRFNDLLLGKVTTDMQVIQEKGTTLWQMKTVDMANKDVHLNANGTWLVEAGKPGRTHFATTMNILNGGGLLSRFGLKDAIKGGHGELKSNISWTGSPFTPDVSSLCGTMDLKLYKGIFLKADPGMGRILSAISLQSLTNRLTLDFRDLLSKGLAFDEIDMQANIDQGLLYSNNFKMNGVTAAVFIEGKLNLIEQTQRLHVVVVPEVNAAGASLAAAFINPAIGVGTFLVQMFLRAPLMKQFTFAYEVDGSWNAPQIHEKKANEVVSKLRELDENQ